MQGVISYSLFRGSEDLVFNYYLRGVYFNHRMNRLIYPDWHILVTLESVLFTDPLVDEFLQVLREDGLSVYAGSDKERCKSMLWRIKPVFESVYSHVICRDLDAITTYRETQAVNQWLKSGKPIHGILDNPAHGGLMGGMCGLETAFIKSKFKSWDDMVKGANLEKHGSDQNLLNKLFGKEDIFWSNNIPHYTDNKLWESELTCRHIGSAGVVEMELLRFFQRFDPNPKWDEFEKQFPEICYWRR